MIMDSRIKNGIYNCPNCGAAATPESVRCSYCHSSLAAGICPKCYGAIFVGMQHCPWCGENAAAGNPAEDVCGKCPRCNQSFLHIEISNRTLNECSVCGGLWVDNNTLQEICENKEQQQAIMGFNPAPVNSAGAIDVKSGRVYVPCPVCKKLMNRRQFAGCSGVIVDWCNEHGVWFDRNELKQIVQFILAGGLNKARTREKLAMEEELQNLRHRIRNLETHSSLSGDLNLSASNEGAGFDFLEILGGIWKSF
jgi:Zn-finger nucleic acid-binding protein